jgi:translation initiation factor 5
MSASLLGPSSGGNSINIRRDVQDAFYRYKMPRLQSKIEGKGNGIKTVVPNMVDIGKALGRPAAYITKFFGAELGALSTCDEKAAKYIINGAHDAEKLQTLLDVFIAKFVLCPNCENPETVLSVSKKDGTVFRTCQACGHRATVDLLHKLCSYIRANPPPKPAKKTQAKDRADETSELTGMGSVPAGDQIEGMIVPEDFDDSLHNAPTNVDEDDWDEETAAALRADELSRLSENVRQKLSLEEANKEEDKTKASRTDELMDALDSFGDWLGTQPDNAAIIQEVETRNLRTDKAVVVLVQVLFAEDFIGTFKTRMTLLQKLVTDEKEQKALLGAVERLVGVVNTALLAKTSMILQALYSSDLLDEDVLVEWQGKLSKKYVSKEVALQVRSQAQPFFDWLDTASSD